MKLFDENLGNIKTEAELALLQARFPVYDVDYIVQSAYPLRQKAKEFLWAKLD